MAKGKGAGIKAALKSAEVPIVRRNFGVASWQYNSFMAEATQSRGMTPALTLDARAEILSTSQTVAAGVDYALSGSG
jgi:hypothetical protein